MTAARKLIAGHIKPTVAQINCKKHTHEQLRQPSEKQIPSFEIDFAAYVKSSFFFWTQKNATSIRNQIYVLSTTCVVSCTIILFAR